MLLQQGTVLRALQIYIIIAIIIVVIVYCYCYYYYYYYYYYHYYYSSEKVADPETVNPESRLIRFICDKQWIFFLAKDDFLFPCRASIA